MKFSLTWLGDFVDTERAGDAERVRRLLEQAGFPTESIEPAGEDSILDVEITPNRPDAMSHRGLAREVSAMGGLSFANTPPPPPSESGPAAAEETSIEIAVPRLCRRFGARLVRGVRGAPAPARVRERLSAIGAKPISAAVDATNYVLWEIGQPLHAFDFDKLAGRRLIVRRARRGERLTLLDGVERQLEPSDIVVADADRAVSLAGIMGGLDTAVTGETRNVLLEAAWWDPVAIRRTSRRLGLHTDASHRFERGADAESIPEALDRAASILLESAGGTLASGRIDARGLAHRARRVLLRLSRLRLLAGDDRLELEFAADALQRLGFAVARRGRRLSVDVPSWRPDVAIEDDLVEEVLRVYSYDRLPSRLPAARGGGGHLESLRELEERLADAAAAAGLLETMSDPFVDRASDEGPFASWLSAAGSAPEPLSVANPLDERRRDLRSTLLPRLLDAAALNAHRGEQTVGLFEIGRVFDRPGNPSDPPSFESRRFAFVLAGDWRAHWSASPESRPADFFDGKGLVERLLSPWVAPERLRWKPFAAEAFSPGAAALFETAETGALGVLGRISPAEMLKRKLSESIFAAEVLIDSIPKAVGRATFVPFSPYPPIELDLSFSHPREIDWETIERFIAEQGLTDLATLEVLDRYEGPGTPEGRVKTTVRLGFRSGERTLSHDEINRERDRLASALKEGVGAEL